MAESTDAAKTFPVQIVSAEQNVWRGQATQIVATTVDGQIGVLVDHEPLLALLAPGPVRVTEPGGNVVEARASDGFLSVEPTTGVRVVAREAGLTAQA